MLVTDAMLHAAVRKAVEVELLPKAGPGDMIEESWRQVKAVVEAALAEADDGPIAGHTPAKATATIKGGAIDSISITTLGPTYTAMPGGRETTSPSDDLGPYCHECGNDDRKRLACVDNYANGTRWRCETCGHEFHTGPKPPEE
jgi:ribosomal protein L37AE/L43A